MNKFRLKLYLIVIIIISSFKLQSSDLEPILEFRYGLLEVIDLTNEFPSVTLASTVDTSIVTQSCVKIVSVWENK